MKITNLLLSLSLLLLSSNKSFSKSKINWKDSLKAAELHVYGRSVQDVSHVELISSAAHFGFSFTGTDCEIFAFLRDANAHNYLQYELDGVYQKRIKIEGSQHRSYKISTPTGGQHTVWIFKATEAHTGPIFIEKIKGKQIKSLKKPEAPLIEFIGNSITCGALADPSDVACGTGDYHDQHNAYQSYASRVARTLGTQYMLSSVSGIGIYRNWNSDGPTMPQVYEKVDFQNYSQRQWKFETYSPAIVSIALGTNDYSNGDGIKPRLPFDSSIFVSTYIKFVQLVKSKYPNAQIALLTSPMINGERNIILQSCLKTIKQKIDAQFPKDKAIALYFFKEMQPRGCSWHPSVEDHSLMAEEIIPFFKELLNK